jgi:PAS domain S-box-containing protein
VLDQNKKFSFKLLRFTHTTLQRQLVKVTRASDDAVTIHIAKPRNFQPGDAGTTEVGYLNALNDSVLISEAEVLGCDGARIIYTNDAFTEMTGYSPIEIIGNSPRTFHGPNTDPGTIKQIKQALALRKVFQGSIRYYKKSGEQFDAELSVTPIKDETGWSSRWISVQRDLTKQNQLSEQIKAQENRLLESQAKLFNHIENTPLGCISWDRSFHCIEWNKSAERIFGYSAEEAIGQHARLIIPEHLHDVIDDVFKQLLEQTGGSYSRNDNLHKDGHHIVCDWYNTPIVDTSGHVYGVSSLIHDATEEIRNAQLAKRDTNLLEYSQSAARVGGWELNLETNELYWTAETYRIHDTSPEEFDPTVDAGVSYFLPESKRIIEAALERATTIGEGYELELDTFTTKGRLISVYTTCSVTLKDGRPYLLTGIFQDITERKRSEDEILRERTRLESILATAADGIVILDNAAMVISLNQAAENLFRTKSADVVGKHASQLMTDPDAMRQEDYVMRYLENGLPRIVGKNRELTGKRMDGTQFPMQLSLSEWFHGKERFFTAVVRDISEQKSIQAQLVQSQKLESLGELSGGLAHDFNNLLAIIIGNLDIVQGELKHSHLVSGIEAAITAAERGTNITDRLLRLASSNHHQIGTRSAHNVNHLLEDMVSICESTLGPTFNIKLNLNEQPLWVKLDPAEFENVVLNLILNSKDAMPQGGCICIDSSIAKPAQPHPFHADDEVVLVSLKDDGRGMAPELKNKVFEPFFTTKAGKGTGLGLAMVQSFVKSAGGIVVAESEVGVGTTMNLYLPLTQPTTASDQNARNTDGSHDSNEQILIVDDEPALLEVVNSILERMGYRTLCANDADTAKTLLAANRDIDLLLTDVVMPGGTLGTDLARYAKEQRPDIRILLMSGFTETADNKATGADEFPLIHKPFRKSDLASILRDLLEQPL